jgi:hypothetical protein
LAGEWEWHQDNIAEIKRHRKRRFLDCPNRVESAPTSIAPRLDPICASAHIRSCTQKPFEPSGVLRHAKNDFCRTKPIFPLLSMLRGMVSEISMARGPSLRGFAGV